MSSESLLANPPGVPKYGCARTVNEMLPSPPPRTGVLQMKPSFRMARIVMDVADIAAMSESAASSVRNSPGRIVAPARTVCCRSIR